MAAKIILAAALAVFSSAGSGQSTHENAHAQHSASAVDGCYQHLRQAMERMHEQMAAVKPSSPPNADVDFARLMLPHHQAAIEMAKVELECGNDPQMKRLAQEIVTEQQSEMELMQLWLKKK